MCSATLVYNSTTSSMRYHLAHKHKKADDADATTSSQTSIRDFTIRQKCDKGRAEKMTQLIAEMTAEDLLPISFVEGEGFKRLMNYVKPHYTVPSRKTVTARIDALYEKCACSLKDSLSKPARVAITTDSWTSLTAESYMTLTCHYINEWKIHNAVLETRGFEERHTAVNIANYLKDATEKWLLSSEKVMACVHDNAANMVLANRSLWESVPCFAHTLQLAINEGFNVATVKNVIAASSRLVSHFHHSTVATAALRQKQQEQNIPDHKLIQHCRTRWNSVCDMFERLLEQRWAVCAVQSDRNVTKLADARTLDLKDEHWQTVEELTPVLKSLKCATTTMCSETHVSSSMVYPITHSLITRHLNTQRSESPRVSEFKNAVAESLKRRIVAVVEDAEKVYLPLIAAALDPRHKHLKFLETELRERVKENLKQLCETIPNPVRPIQSKPDSATALDTLFGEDYGTSDVSPHDTEIESYFREPCISVNQDPLLWWKVNESRFAKLSTLAQWYLAVPATSVPAERVFSTAGLIVNRLRTRLSSEHVDRLIFLNKNM